MERNNTRRRITGLMLAGIVLWTSKAQASDLSNWARLEVLDADRYGIYPWSWKDHAFKLPMEEGRIDEILKNVDRKTKEVGLSGNKDFKPVEVRDKTSRSGFLKSIYNIIGRYDEKSNMDPILYLSNLGIVKGSENSLHLNRRLTSEEAVIFSKRAIYEIYNLQDKASKGLLWEVKNKGNTVYMLGSIHMADSSIYPFSKRIIDRFNQSDKLFVEVDISDQEAANKVMMEKIEAENKSMKYEAGRNLKDDLDPEIYASLKSIMDENGIAEENYIDTKLWGIIPQISTFKILNEMELEEGKKEVEEEISEEELEKIMVNMEEENKENPSDFGIDLYLIKRAKAMNMPVGELETIEDQMELLMGTLFKNPYKALSIEDQIEKLKEEIEKFKNPIAENKDKKELENQLENGILDFQNQLRGMLEAWQDADALKLKTLFLQSDQEELQTSILGERDIQMAKKISEMLESEGEKTYFVVVGAAHYVVDGMTIDNLKNMGYEVKSLNIN